MGKRKILAALALPLALVASGPAAGAARPEMHHIVMANMRFGPVPAGIKAGDVIVWVNRDIVPHTATARDGSFDVTLAAGQSRRMRVTKAGTFAFHCRYHPGMRGVLTAAP